MANTNPIPFDALVATVREQLRLGAPSVEWAIDGVAEGCELPANVEAALRAYFEARQDHRGPARVNASMPTNSATTAKHGHYEALDGMRGIAAIAVMIHHYTQNLDHPL